VPAGPPYLIEPIFEQFTALMPERNVDHALGYYRPRIPERVVFEIPDDCTKVYFNLKEERRVLPSLQPYPRMRCLH
jgi:hypothetical protein